MKKVTVADHVGELKTGAKSSVNEVGVGRVISEGWIGRMRISRPPGQNPQINKVSETASTSTARITRRLSFMD